MKTKKEELIKIWGSLDIRGLIALKRTMLEVEEDKDELEIQLKIINQLIEQQNNPDYCMACDKITDTLASGIHRECAYCAEDKGEL